MESVSVTNHRIEIKQSDLAAWFGASVEDIVPGSVQIAYPKLAGDAFLVTVPVSELYMDAFLRGHIPTLPALGNYKYMIMPHSSDVVGVITWDE